jgi:heme oxygenase (mycobilin-producing)
MEVTVSYVVVNAIDVPPEKRGAIEERFANRAGEVSKAEGFESFEFLRPVNAEAGDRYLVMTRWSSKEAFEAWYSSPAFTRGHAQSSSPSGRQKPVATGSEVWHYEVIQEESK